MLTVSKTSIVTGICCGKIDSEINLHHFFDKLQISDSILGAKFHGNTKGSVSDNKSFFNQITLVVKTVDKTVNVKIFGNGNLHFSGIKNLGHAQDCIDRVIPEIIRIRGEEKIELLAVNGVLYDKKNYEKYSSCSEKNRFEMTTIYSYPEIDGKVKVIGFKKYNDHIINGELVVVEDNYFVSSRFKNCVKKIFNKSGKEVGYYSYVSVYKRKNIILKGKTLIIESDTLTTVKDLYGNTIGAIHRTLLPNADIPLSQIDSGTFLTEYCCIADIEKLKNLNLKISNLNCKFTVSSPYGSFFDKAVLHEILSNKEGLESYLNKDSGYQGLSVKIYYLDKKVSILFFRTGTVLLSGCVSKSEIVRAKTDFVKILQDNKDKIMKKDMVKVDVLDESLTIWNIM